jgi:hypothetical protein
MRTSLLASPLLLFALAPSTASADPVVAVGVGGGHLGCSTPDGNCDGQGPVQAGSLTVAAGGRLDRNLALLGLLTVASHNDSDSTVSQFVLAPTLRYWAAPMLWLEGGVGVAHTEVSYMSGGVDVVERSETVPAVVGAVGVDVVRSRDFAFDVDLRGARGFYANDVHVYQGTLGVGVTL